MADAAPTAVGANATLMVHEPAGATVVQLLARENSPGLAPTSVAPVTARSDAPVLLTVTV